MEYFQITKFKGLNTRDSSVEIEDNEAQVCQNVVLDDPVGAITKRSGTARYGDDFADKKVTALYPFYYGSGTKKFLAVAGTDIYLESSGTWTAQSQTLTENKEPHFATFIDSGSNETAIMVNGAETLDYTGAAWAALGGTPPAATKYIATFYDLSASPGGRVYLANNATNPNRVWYSAIGDSESWSTGAGGDWFDVPAVKDGDDITGLAPFQNRLIIFKRYSIWSWDGIRLKLVVKGVGCISQNSVAKSENFLYFLSYVDSVKAFALSGDRVTEISDKISTDLNSLATAQLTSAAGAYFNDRYYLSVGSASANNNDTVYVYMEAIQGWTKYTDMNALCFAVYRASNTEELYYGEATADSLVIKMETGSADWSTSSGASDAVIKAKWQSKDFGNAASYNHYHTLYATYKSQSVTSNLETTAIIDQGKQYIEGLLAMKGTGITYNGGYLYDNDEVYGGKVALTDRYRTTGRGSFINVEFKNYNASQPFTVYSTGFSFEPLIPR